MLDDNNWGMVENTVQAQLDEEILSSETTVDYRVPAADTNEIADSTRNWVRGFCLCMVLVYWCFPAYVVLVEMFGSHYICNTKQMQKILEYLI